MKQFFDPLASAVGKRLLRIIEGDSGFAFIFEDGIVCWAPEDIEVPYFHEVIDDFSRQDLMDAGVIDQEYLDEEERTRKFRDDQAKDRRRMEYEQLKQEFDPAPPDYKVGGQS